MFRHVYQAVKRLTIALIGQTIDNEVINLLFFLV